MAYAAGLLAWAGAAAQGADVSLLEMLGAGANTLPLRSYSSPWGRLFSRSYPARARSSLTASSASPLSLGALRCPLGGAGLAARPFPPFHDVGLVPGEPFEPIAAAVMLVLAACVTLAALWAFRRRDLVGTIRGFGVPPSVVATAPARIRFSGRNACYVLTRGAHLERPCTARRADATCRRRAATRDRAGSLPAPRPRSCGRAASAPARRGPRGERGR